MLNRVSLPISWLTSDRRGQPILWLSSHIPSPSGPVPAISLVSPTPQEEGQLFNNYGAKSNEALLLGYGFTIPSNPDDTLVLQLGGVPESIRAVLETKGLDAGKRFEVGRDGEMPAELVRTVRVMMADSGCDCCGGEGTGDEEHGHKHEHGHDEEEGEDEEDEHAAHEKEVAEFELELDVLGMLGNMLEDKLSRLEDMPEAEGARPRVREMVETYRRGKCSSFGTS